MSLLVTVVTFQVVHQLIRQNFHLSLLDIKQKNMFYTIDIYIQLIH